MFCEYCQTNLSNVGDVRRHILTASHSRNRERFHLSKSNYDSALKQAHDRPKDFCELLKLLKLNSPGDIKPLEDAGFFRIDTNSQNQVVRTLINVIDQYYVDFNLKQLPPDLRKKIVEAYNKHNK